MRDDYDVIVVGAGPAGSTAARYAASTGVRVLLLEKDREVGIPVRCAEAVGETGLRAMVEPRKRWLANKIEALRLVAPNGKWIQIQSPDIGYVLDRKIFDYDLAQMAAQEGARILTKAYVYGLIKQNGKVTGVKVWYLGRDYHVGARVVIGADGVESRVGRWAGLKTHIRMHDLETCAQMTVTHIELDSRYGYFYFSSQIAPGGYLWVLPKGRHIANVGLGISGDYSGEKSPLKYLREFMQQHFPTAAVLTTVAGAVPCANSMKKIVTNGVMLVGDAAHQANPLSGGGIIRAMAAGKLAGQVAAQAVKENDVSDKRLGEYENEWNRTEGRVQQRLYRLKEAIYKMTDEDLNHTAEVLLKIEPEKRTIVNIFKTALINQPRLILDVMKVFV